MDAFMEQKLVSLHSRIVIGALVWGNGMACVLLG